ncbi:hypothetical protein C8A03DRAFT_35467 [Achaetomium macrosporum]|uniref:Uncharacterized protein n=1 Tax=Achaetomium macrosporum TaxID=79813 RepID=A0AAN7H601_9PEZI|nr:hypothetical protein C8A03DRAFT_35467 [Achaetomium macrosporum]
MDNNTFVHSHRTLADFFYPSAPSGPQEQVPEGSPSSVQPGALPPWVGTPEQWRWWPSWVLPEEQPCPPAPKSAEDVRLDFAAQVRDAAARAAQQAAAHSPEERAMLRDLADEGEQRLREFAERVREAATRPADERDQRAREAAARPATEQERKRCEFAECVRDAALRAQGIYKAPADAASWWEVPDGCEDWDDDPCDLPDAPFTIHRTPEAPAQLSPEVDTMPGGDDVTFRHQRLQQLVQRPSAR